MESLLKEQSDLQVSPLSRQMSIFLPAQQPGLLFGYSDPEEPLDSGIWTSQGCAETPCWEKRMNWLVWGGTCKSHWVNRVHPWHFYILKLREKSRVRREGWSQTQMRDIVCVCLCVCVGSVSSAGGYWLWLVPITNSSFNSAKHPVSFYLILLFCLCHYC